MRGGAQINDLFCGHVSSNKLRQRMLPSQQLLASWQTSPLVPCS
jgi:hypothetical protein